MLVMRMTHLLTKLSAEKYCHQLLLAALCLILIPGYALAELQLIPDPPVIEASGYILMDANSGVVIAKNNSNERIEPASLTKIMASYVVADAIKSGKISLTDEVLISKKASAMAGSRMIIQAGAKINVELLLKGMIVQSGNDATIALAEHVAGDEDNFVVKMNETAAKLDLRDTHYANATGLPNDEHYSSPHDISQLGVALIQNHPDIYKYYSIKEFTYNGIKQFNRNQLLWKDDSVDGINTGYTDSAGYCLSVSAIRGSMRLVSTVVGAKNKAARITENQKLLNYGFRFFETHKLYASNDKLTEVKIWKGLEDNLPLGITQDLYVTIPRGQYEKLVASMSINSTIVAPASAGDVFGTVNVNLGTKTVAKRDLVALDDVPQGQFWHNLIDSVMLWWKKVVN